MKRIGFQALGWVLLGLGIVGLFLPFLPGVLLLMAGLFILSREYTWAERTVQSLRKRFPALSRKSEAWWHRTRLRWGSDTN